MKLVITNYDAGRIEMLSGEINHEDPSAGDREIPFSNTLLIEREDFKEVAERKFFRLSLGQEVRLKSAYIVKAESVQKDANGRVTEVYCTYDPDSLSGSGSEASLRKVKLWVLATTSSCPGKSARSCKVVLAYRERMVSIICCTSSPSRNCAMVWGFPSSMALRPSN